MPVTIKIANHEASRIRTDGETSSAESILDSLSKPGDSTRGTLIQSSFDKEIEPVMQPSRNGFLFSVTQAYNNHHHLVIRPDDVWLAITTQFSSYVKPHAEELRGSFVNFEGQKTLVIEYENSTRFTVDYADFAHRINDLLEANIVDPGLRQWITPSFTTTTQLDKTVSAIVMMGTLQKYFKYISMCSCGIPSVTLLGERADYEQILGRLDRLCQYGEEPTEFCRLLKPVLQNFVRTFDEPDHAEVLSFWQRICDYTSGSGMFYYSGWITAFCFWNNEGRAQLASRWTQEVGGQEYAVVDSQNIPSGFTKVPVHINDNGEEAEAEMIAGSVGITCTSSGREVVRNPYLDPEGVTIGLDTMQPQSGWFIYEKE